MQHFTQQRERMVQRYRTSGYIKSEKLAKAMLRVPREAFMDRGYVDYSYNDQPYPIPGDGRQTISAPYMYPIFYEPLGLEAGDKLLEVGAGSGYGAALARELVGPTGLVVAIEINPVTYSFAEANLLETEYNDILLILGDGSLGYMDAAPYNAICITAACPNIPKPLMEQLRAPGKLLAPVGKTSGLFGQDLVMIEKDGKGHINRKNLMKVAYVPLLGEHGWSLR
jgi:protein-L-isoaspartate(D-aspartate) O-methyltransferase